MGLIDLLTKETPNRVFLAIVMGILAGAFYSALIPLILNSITPVDPSFVEYKNADDTFLSFEVTNYSLASLYFFLCVMILVARSTSEIILLRVGADVAKGIRTKIYHSIGNAPQAALEKFGSAKIIASINLDIPRIVMAAGLMPSIFVNLVTLVGILLFLFYLDSEIFQLVTLAIVVGGLIYQLPIASTRKIFERSREANDSLQEALRALIYGSKELKLDIEKRKKYFENVLLTHENDVVATEKLGFTISSIAICLGDLITFVVIGIIAYIFVNYYTIDAQTLIAVIMVLLYITGPVALILNSVSGVIRGMVSFRKVSSLLAHIPSEKINKNLVDIPSWETMSFKDVVYSYPSVSDEKGFTLSPINLAIHCGEITFIVGGNGSGKSTISKLITQHYAPVSGDIYFDSTLVTANLVTSYRQDIFAIYSDYYLFDQLLIDVTPETEALAQGYLEKLCLDKKVKIENGVFSTTSLSDGQRRRLALLVAVLEDKKLYLFDEWAADQDPEFRNIFYTSILPDLKARGKAVVVISHDDRYFYVADKVLFMDEGELVDTQNNDTNNAENKIINLTETA